MNNNFAAIVVSAGYSSRMHDFKPLLQFGERPALTNIIRVLKTSGVKDIVVVIGHRGDELKNKIQETGIRYVYNENYPQGMYSSVVKGVKEIDGEAPAFFLWPVDIPLIKEETIRLLMKEFKEKNKGIIHPTFDGKRGHPPLIHSKYIKAITEGDGAGGLKRILEQYEDDALDLPLWDEAILMDMDTKEDYNNLLEYFHREAPSRQECLEILKFYKLPENIIRHSLKVSEISLKLLESLGDKGDHIDKNILEAAALLHDIARLEKNHDKKGARMVERLGYSKLAGPISTHIDISVDRNEKITEAELLYLADKLVKEDQLMPLDVRLGEQKKAYMDKPMVLAKIEERYQMAGRIMDKIKKANGDITI